MPRKAKTAKLPKEIECTVAAISHAARGIQLLTASIDPIGRKDRQRELRQEEAYLNFMEAGRWVERAGGKRHDR